jgi:DNA invertase Pin-like site-specific DNA recombinase
MDAAQYLRKSRMEEGMETEEVLARHRAALAEYAAKHDIHIIATYEEVKSGESLYARPEMLRLLEDVEAGQFDAVLCMDLDRLSRGRMKDQGIILDAFRESSTLIVTPEKTYNLSDEIDDELAEFKTFMSRREYKIINKRLRRGLIQSINDGWYVANAPYGYRKVTVDRRPTLEIVEEEAQYVRMMYEMYINGSGCVKIARHVTALGARPRRANAFNRSTVAMILRNPTYAGKVVWNQKSHIKKGTRGNPKHITIYNPRESWTITEGRHPAIIDQETYDKVQEILAGRYIPSKNDGTIKSPLAGLVKCANCGRNMQRMEMHKGVTYLLCNTTGCCAGAKFEFVEERVVQHLRDTLAQLTADQPAQPTGRQAKALESDLTAIRKEQTAAQAQKTKLYELLETGVYDLPTFQERMAAVKAKIISLDEKEKATLRTISDAQQADPASLAAKIQTLLDAYDTADGAARNAMLKGVINRIWYTKAKKTKPKEFELQFDMKAF